MEQVTTFRAVRAARGAGTMIHRPSCKRAADKGNLVTEDELTTWARPIKAATCCKPRFRATAAEAREASAGFARALAAENEAAAAEPSATDLLARGEAVPGGPGACTECHHGKVWHRPKTRNRPCERCACPAFKDEATEARREAENNRVERLAAAKVERKAVQLWERDGKAKGEPQPATPNLDAIAAEEAEGERTTVGAKHVAKANGNGTRQVRQSDNPRVQATREASAACGTKRGPGVKVTDAELVEYIAKHRAAHPEDTLAIAREFAYYVDKLAFSGPRWAAAWAEAEAK